MFNIYLVMMNYLLFKKRNSIRQGKLQLIPSQILKAIELKNLNLSLLKLNQIKDMFNIYLVMMNYLVFQKRNSIRQGKLQLIPIVSLYHLMKKQVMIGQ